MSSSAGLADRFVLGGQCSRDMPCFRVCTRVFDVSFGRVAEGDPDAFVLRLRQRLSGHSLLGEGTFFSVSTWVESDPGDAAVFLYRCLVVFSKPLPLSSAVDAVDCELKDLFGLDCVGYLVVYSVSCRFLVDPPIGFGGDIPLFLEAVRRRHLRQAEQCGARLLEGVESTDLARLATL